MKENIGQKKSDPKIKNIGKKEFGQFFFLNFV